MSVFGDQPPGDLTDSTIGHLTGQEEGHLCSSADAELLGVRVNRAVVRPFLQLRDDARRGGFDLQILSGFRSFEKQLSIWNRKATGKLAVLDSDAVPLDIARLSERDLVFAILRWSALPGASRHHWGTDLDVYDAAARPEGYEVELIPEEVDSGGMFAALHEWLDERIAADDAFGFFRPYDQDRQGVAPERWHLSHAPTAAAYERQLTNQVLRGTIERGSLELKEAVLLNLDEIYERFVINTNKRLA
ncbi:MAG: M15 family metallopeptidase [Gemmatimonadota bacterium]|nr:MAG: M15 family metallopeptidase [Gemmatimonadota bacterium]